MFSYEFCQIRTLLWNTSGRWFLNKFSFELSSVISKVFIADFQHVFFCWERCRITIAVLWIIEKLYLANKSLLKVNNRNSKTRCEMLKVNSRDCVFLLTNYNISKTFFQVFFWCTVNMSLPYSFLMSLLSILNRFHMLWYSFSVISFKRCTKSRARTG